MEGVVVPPGPCCFFVGIVNEEGFDDGALLLLGEEEKTAGVESDLSNS